MGAGIRLLMGCRKIMLRCTDLATCMWLTTQPLQRVRVYVLGSEATAAVPVLNVQKRRALHLGRGVTEHLGR